MEGIYCADINGEKKVLDYDKMIDDKVTFMLGAKCQNKNIWEKYVFIPH